MLAAVKERETSVELWGAFQAACQRPSDINEHLPVLRKLGLECEHITEFGTRFGIGSTIAFLAAQPAQFITWDIEPQPIVDLLNLCNLSGRTRFQPRVGSTLEIEIEETDLLFIDTFHTYDQLKAELTRHAMAGRRCKVRKFLAFHDVSTFGRVGEDGTAGGLEDAIQWFEKNNFPLWRPIYRTERNNGLLILQKESDLEKNGAPREIFRLIDDSLNKLKDDESGENEPSH